ncbi:MAG: hypothetical protein FJX36_09165 [Alphaproteobacteria bacterium]|nr:hypothetical protein [Alphaproteobacteria bacterium]
MLGPDEPAPYEVVNAGGRAPVLLVCDHASPRIPTVLGDLGLAGDDRIRHIAWDIGADASHLFRAGISTAIYGPGKVNDINPLDESMAVADAVGAARTYALAILEICGRDGGVRA